MNLRLSLRFWTTKATFYRTDTYPIKVISGKHRDYCQNFKLIDENYSRGHRTDFKFDESCECCLVVKDNWNSSLLETPPKTTTNKKRKNSAKKHTDQEAKRALSSPPTNHADSPDSGTSLSYNTTDDLGIDFYPQTRVLASGNPSNQVNFDLTEFQDYQRPNDQQQKENNYSLTPNDGLLADDTTNKESPFDPLLPTDPLDPKKGSVIFVNMCAGMHYTCTSIVVGFTGSYRDAATDLPDQPV